jgi:hypothetical protein
MLSAVSTATPTISPGFFDRLCRGYRSFLEGFEEPSEESMWSSIGDRRRNLHDALMAGDSAAINLLCDPRQTMMYWGVDDIHAREPLDTFHQEGRAAQAVEAITQLAYIFGLSRWPNPEGGTRGKPPAMPSFEEILTGLEAYRGLNVIFPNPFAGEGGLATTRGIAGIRAVNAIYQAWLLKQIAQRSPGKHILEIGAGIGRTAFYAHRFGVRNYTIVDLPMTLIGQAVFLGLTLGEDVLRFGNEAPSDGTIELLSPRQFEADARRFEIVLNADSIPEMDYATAVAYADRMRRDRSYFLSINHEANGHRVFELVPPAAHISRSPYPLRNGYLEERFDFSLIPFSP